MARSGPAIPLTCPACAHSYSTSAREVTRCPACRRSQRIPAQLRHQAEKHDRSSVSTQVTASHVATAARPVVVPVDRSHVVAPAVSRSRVPAPRPPYQPPPDIDDEDDDDEESGPDADSLLRQKTYDAIARVQANGKPQVITAPTAVVARIVAFIRTAGVPDVEWNIASAASQTTLILRRTDEPLEIPQPEISLLDIRPMAASLLNDAAQKIRDSWQREPSASCSYCGAVAGINTPALYVCSGGPLETERVIVCQRHAQQYTMAGSRAVPVQ